MTEKFKIGKGDQIVITRSPTGSGVSLSVHLAPKSGGMIATIGQNFSLEEALGYIRATYDIS